MVANLNQYTKGLNSDVSDYFSTGLGFEASKSKFLKRDFESYKIKKLLGMFNWKFYHKSLLILKRFSLKT